MSKNYNLVYMLAAKDRFGGYDPLPAHGEFQNRAAAKEYVKENSFILPDNVYLIRKETAFFFDRKLDKPED